MRLQLINTAVLTALVAIVPVAHAATTRLTVRPTKPFVDDDVAVTFKVAKRLPVGWHYEGLLSVRSGGRRDCTSIVISTRSRRRPVKGQLMRLTFRPDQDIVADSYEWCQGKATVSILRARNDDTGGNTGVPLGSLAFRFYAKP